MVLLHALVWPGIRDEEHLFLIVITDYGNSAYASCTIDEIWWRVMHACRHCCARLLCTDGGYGRRKIECRRVDALHSHFVSQGRNLDLEDSVNFRNNSKWMIQSLWSLIQGSPNSDSSSKCMCYVQTIHTRRATSAAAAEPASTKVFQMSTINPEIRQHLSEFCQHACMHMYKQVMTPNFKINWNDALSDLHRVSWLIHLKEAKLIHHGCAHCWCERCRPEAGASSKLIDA